MFLGELGQDVTTLRGVGPATAGRFHNLGVRTLRDLLLHMPRGYEDRTKIVPLAQAPEGEKAFVAATVVSQTDFGRGRGKTVKALVTDGTGSASLVCFGRPFMRTILQPGRKLFIWGSFKERLGELQSTDFEVEPWREAPAGSLKGNPTWFGMILPQYPLTEGLNQGTIRRIMRRALQEIESKLENELPEPLMKRRGIPAKTSALTGIHFPESLAGAGRCRSALAYEELFWFELLVMRRRMTRLASRTRNRTLNGETRDLLLARLPFRLTDDQVKVSAEIEADLSSSIPMARLLQGDVGCGKTLVALLTALLVIPGGDQVAFLAPTELLARQHAENAVRLLESIGVRAAFLSGSVTGEARRLLFAALKEGEIDILFGTHALFSEEVNFRALGLVIIDEQHKFGVMQRMAILGKGESPDLLLMTATPIPRTLALTAFGDLDVSTITTMPAGRKKVITHLAREGNEEKVYRRVREEIAKGRQAYFVYPLIEESQALSVKDAESMFRTLKQKVYPDLRLALIHSRIAEVEKQRAMARFVSGEIDILVATSVVEVGVDVANATCMVVERAERFGLSTLHQLRGRVGRGEEQSYAFLVYGRALTDDGVQRLKIMMETTDGFRIARRDLELRGPGELLGMRQSGFPELKIADLLVHGEELLAARDDAAQVLRDDPGFLLPHNAVLARVLAAAPPFSGSSLQGG
jgi:ATP-dependent DNA helicase RecG